MTEVRNELVRKRYAAERRFRFYGAAALGLTALFLAFLLVDIVSKGLPAFRETSVEVDVTVDAAEVDPANLAGGNYDKMIKEAFRAEFPDVKGRTERKALSALLSSGGADTLRSMVIADPALIGKTVTVPVLLGDDADLFLKGLLTRVKTTAGAMPLHIAQLDGEEGFVLTGDKAGEEAERQLGLAAGDVIRFKGGALRVTGPQNGYLKAEPIFAPDPAITTLAAGQWDVLAFSVPESNRRISDAQVLWLDQLKSEGRIETSFAWRLFEAGDSREPELAGIRGALIGSLLTVLVAISLALPLGIAAAIYLEEFAPKNRWTDLIEVNINNLAAVPSIIFGLLGLAVFLNFFGMPRSAPLVGGLVLALLVLPTIIIASRAALKAVPPSITEAALGVGASKQQAVFQHVLPLALPGIMTGTILGLARAFGETAPLLMIGMVAFIADIPSGFTSAATVLPVQVFLWSDLPEMAFQSRTAAAIIVLLVVLFALNAVAIYLRKRFERRW
ncbi:phosphate ABC transporter permease PtsA [Aestuariivirga litoralis]|uniref:Phosphate transport system permease protein PstA n=1 Tax=Aestuariivirga litoralis TaxID=2650924 RepID=A0A2W2C958_9HYPH|nr:phosphate ABC transporter permease PstA [Aestuariivirga litoralis]PZF76703.1 phosphate ABC transporter permease PtsA [Aestuariivirga litoralis]